MLKKSILLAILLVSIVLTNAEIIQSNSSNVKSSTIELRTKSQNTHMERVLIDGVWWIIIYADDGSVINMYEDPIQD